MNRLFTPQNRELPSFFYWFHLLSGLFFVRVVRGKNFGELPGIAGEYYRKQWRGLL
jgi:hypothetical protein